MSSVSPEERENLIKEWYQTYSSFLHLYASQFVDFHSAEEIVQETFRVVCETADIHEIRYPKAWLRKVASLVLKNWLRAREKWRAILIELEPLPEGALGQREDPVNVELEYAGFIKPDELRLLELLSSGYTYADAARELDSTAEACRKRAKRAGAVLEAKLRRCEA